jgi:hypothetical protein
MIRGMFKKCSRVDCRFFEADVDNNCMALQDVYEDDSKCQFHKNKEEEVKSNGSKRSH